MAFANYSVLLHQWSMKAPKVAVHSDKEFNESLRAQENEEAQTGASSKYLEIIGC